MPSQLSTLNPQLIDGSTHADARGTLCFVNDFDFQGVDRFYWITAATPGVPRGWVGHRREHKWFTAVHGEVMVAVVQPDNWEQPSRDLPVTRFTLSAASPQVLHVPAGHATANVSLIAGAVLLVFSSGKIEDAKADDFRFPINHWPISKSNPSQSLIN